MALLYRIVVASCVADSYLLYTCHLLAPWLDDGAFSMSSDSVGDGRSCCSILGARRRVCSEVEVGLIGVCRVSVEHALTLTLTRCML